MKIILSPAKKMVSDTDSLAPVNVPKHMDQTAEILSFMKSQSKEELKAVWKCNDKIAEQNFHRLETMDLYRGLTPAVLSYEGIAFQYKALENPVCVLWGFGTNGWGDTVPVRNAGKGRDRRCKKSV